uniref:Uncharacterized protein n=1 Tax=viral metagenome TaxID=1070528 RepID=A0A6H1ZSQ2_9ZZZZ
MRTVIDLKDNRHIKGDDCLCWNSVVGQSRARCTRCDRDIEQEETKITFVHYSGMVRAKGKIWCSKCGAKQKFDMTED